MKNMKYMMSARLSSVRPTSNGRSWNTDCVAGKAIITQPSRLRPLPGLSLG